jgi:hypothetical protein
MEAWLYGLGFVQPQVRLLVRNQICLAAAWSVGLLALTLCSRFSWSFAAGAGLITLNFMALARVAQSLVFYRKGAVFSLLVIFYGKLILAGLALFALIAWAKASVVGLLFGLSTAVVNAIVWGAWAVMHKPKEA